MKKVLYFLIIWGSYTVFSMASNSDVEQMQAMVKRLIPSHADSFIFKQEKSSKSDYFELSSYKGKILITGNNANSMAFGLNYYLKNKCLTTVSWYADISVEMPHDLPLIKKKIHVSAKVKDRFFLNYCTFGYSMTWWNWKDWERFIDWMALNGVNMPLAITGQEYIWYKVWKSLGMSDKEIRSYFTGPSYLPWHRMANIDAWNGPLPMEWLNQQHDLQKKILARERSLNMTPVLPAFSGHVPSALKSLFPKANIQNLGSWAGFEEKYRCSFLNPEDSLFSVIQTCFLNEQTKQFGTNHIYGVDPFNEVDPPSWEPNYLSKVSSNIYRTLSNVDPKAKWLQMTWMFYFDRKKWTSPRVDALLNGVPKGKMILLDYHCEKVELWKKTKKFSGQPYIWCYLGNFGGNTAIAGNVKESGKRLDNAFLHGGANLKGVGSTLEGLDIMQFPYEYIFDKAWTGFLSNNDWIDNLADRHVGYVSKSSRKAWHLLFNEIYIQVPSTMGILVNYEPEMDKLHRRTKIDYSNRVLLKVWKELLLNNESDRDAFKIDIITVGRQLIGNYFLELKCAFDKAYHNKDLVKLKDLRNEMNVVINDLDKLNSYHQYATLSKWIFDARKNGETRFLKDYYERNARTIITSWGGRLDDYASRTWSGLIKIYYAKRWDLYFKTVINAVEKGNTFDERLFHNKILEIEKEWILSQEEIEKTTDNESLISYAQVLWKKYSEKIAKYFF